MTRPFFAITLLRGFEETIVALVAADDEDHVKLIQNLVKVTDVGGLFSPKLKRMSVEMKEVSAKEFEALRKGSQ